MDHRHEVDTLIFTGDADPVTAGGQAIDSIDVGWPPASVP